MAYVSSNYKTNPKAPIGKWTCSPTSALDPFDTLPPEANRKGTDLCGQCVSYVKKVCPTLPQTSKWTKGSAAKDNKDIQAGTVIATFNSAGYYEGHAAIFEKQTDAGLLVYDQYVAGPTPSAVGSRTLRWGAPVKVNNGDEFYVVD